MGVSLEDGDGSLELVTILMIWDSLTSHFALPSPLPQPLQPVTQILSFRISSSFYRATQCHLLLVVVFIFAHHHLCSATRSIFGQPLYLEEEGMVNNHHFIFFSHKSKLGPEISGCV